MSDDWQVGDLALCVDDDPDRNTGLPTGLVRGQIYPVTAVTVVPENYPDKGNIALSIEGPIASALGFRAARFRKIKPDAEPCEAEFTALIKRMKPAKVSS